MIKDPSQLAELYFFISFAHSSHLCSFHVPGRAHIKRGSLALTGPAAPGPALQVMHHRNPRRLVYLGAWGLCGKTDSQLARRGKQPPTIPVHPDSSSSWSQVCAERAGKLWGRGQRPCKQTLGLAFVFKPMEETGGG